MRGISLLAFGLTVSLWSTDARAEYRTVLIQLTQDKDKKPQVSIHSDDQKDKKTNVSVDEAVKTIEKMTGWGSAVGVYVTAKGVADQRPLKKIFPAIIDNAWLDLVQFGHEPPEHIQNYFLKK